MGSADGARAAVRAGNLNPELLISITAARRHQLMSIPGSSARAEWTVQEAGMACGPIRDRNGRITRLEPEIYAALLYSFAGADELYRPLCFSLLQFGIRTRQLDEWPPTVVRDDGNRGEYLEELVGMSLIEERQPWRFGAVEGSPISPIYLAVMRVTRKTWERRLAHPYSALRWRYITWLDIGKAHMRRWIRSTERGEHAQVTEPVAKTFLGP